ncbi:MAG: MOSC domain-containing protein [Pseudonocardia sp.]
MRVSMLRRYPVKSMLGEDLEAAEFTPAGVTGDRGLALVDTETGRVATAKHPRRYRDLLQCAAAFTESGVRVTLPGGATIAPDEVGARVSALLGREVVLTAQRPAGAEVERPAPEDVIAAGVEADVPFAMLEIAQGTPGESFVDYAPVHLITTATLDRLGTEAIRYRPNILVEGGDEAFVENGWVGQEITVGEVVLRGVLPTPRCSVPTLAHGDLPLRPDAVRPLMRDNRVEVPGFGTLPCAGLYAEVLRAGTVRNGDGVRVAG